MNRSILMLAAGVVAGGAAVAIAPFAQSALVRGGEPLILEGTKQSIRVVYFGGSGVSSEYAFEYGQPEWKADYDQSFDAQTIGKRVRFGKDWWSTLSTFGDLEIAKKKVKSGLYDLALERGKKGEWNLVFLDAVEMHKSSIDPFASAQTTTGIVVPLEYAKVTDSAAKLAVRIEAVPGSALEQTWTIRWGPHELKANVKARG